MKTILRERKWLTTNSYVLSLERPESFTFSPGQRIGLQSGGLLRDYSLVSGPQAPTLDILIRRIPGGPMSSHLAELPLETAIEIEGPHGYFIFQDQGNTPLFVATGTGIAPFVSMARTGVRGFRLLHGVRTAEELYFAKEMRACADDFLACLTGGATRAGTGDQARAGTGDQARAGTGDQAGAEAADQSLERVYSGRVTSYVAERLEEGIYDFYACGRAEMIRDLAHIIDERFPSSRLFSESFT